MNASNSLPKLFFKSPISLAGHKVKVRIMMNGLKMFCTWYKNIYIPKQVETKTLKNYK